MWKMIPDWYIDRRDFIEESLKRYLQDYFDSKGLLLWEVNHGWIEKFKEWCFYALEWWKKLRAILALEFFLTLQRKDFKDINFDDDITKFCLALECIHAFSLVHDDLPCMDNDVLRRWKPTVWKKFWEYQALLIGDTLNSLAFEIISEIKNPVLSIKLSNLLARSSGFHWMVWWQIDDMYFEEYPEKINISDLMKLHNRKTGALIKAAVQWWILISEKITHIHKLSLFWEKLWLAFQIKDDLLDVEWSVEETWKSIWDEKKWFVYFMWIEKTKSYLNDTINDCLNIVGILKSENIWFLVWYVKDRKK